MPVSGTWPNYDLKEYEAVIDLTADVQKVKKLKPGLTAEVEIQVQQLDSVLQVPVQAVVGVGDQHVAFVITQRGAEKRGVRIGQASDSAVEIVDGLEEGEQVVLNPRTRFAAEISDMDEMSDPPQADQSDPVRRVTSGDR